MDCLRKPVFAHLLPAVLASAIALGCGSCAHRFHLESPAQLGELPVSQGINMGSFYAETPWQYRGSDAAHHKFYYYFNRDNFMLHRRVILPRANTRLEFPETPVGTSTQWVVLEANPKTFHFRLHLSHDLKHSPGPL